jgi:Zn-dependent protease
MNTTINIGRIWNVPIGFHWSWILIFGLVTWTLASGYLPNRYTNQSTNLYWTIGTVTSLLFFASVLIHELGHTWVALRNGISVKEIKLFIFGGAAELSEEPKKPGAEFRISIAGPLMSVLLSILFAGIYYWQQDIPYVAIPGLWLAQVNLALAIFNMIPAYPLDGGRVLRAIVWYFKEDLNKATKIAALTGHAISIGFIICGVILLFDNRLFNGVWLILIGLYLQGAASASLIQVKTEESVNGLKVNQVMVRQYPEVDAEVSLQQLVDEHALPTGWRFFVVTEDSKPVGLVTMNEVAKVSNKKWFLFNCRQVMVPYNQLLRVGSRMDLLIALKLMDDQNVKQALVEDDGQIVGILSREHTLHHLRLRSELGLNAKRAQQIERYT